jgi:hypothetical protein
MKNNSKKLALIKHGFNNDLLSSLNENQINALHKRLVETKKETKEQTKVEKLVYNSEDPKQKEALNNMLKNPDMLKGKNIEIAEEDEDSMDFEKGQRTQQPKQVGPSTDDGFGDYDDGGDINEDEDIFNELQESFKSKKQQKYFFAKCGDGKTKEQKKWCKMAEEFADKTNFKKLPERKKKTEIKKKTETKEEFTMKDYSKKIGSVVTNLYKEKLADMTKENLEKQVTSLVEKYVSPKMSKRDFLGLVFESGTKEKERTKEREKTKKPGTETPYKPKVKPAPKADTKIAPSEPGIKTPSKPTPLTPYKPKVKPAPKAGNDELPNWLTFDSLRLNIK